MWFVEAQRHASGACESPAPSRWPDAAKHAGKPVIHWLAVVPGFRRRGLGRLLVRTVESTMWKQGERQIWLETHSGWREAAQLYAALGYTTVDAGD